MPLCVAMPVGCCAQVATSGKLKNQEVGDMVNGIDPLWVLVDRVISQQEKKGERDWHSPLPNACHARCMNQTFGGLCCSWHRQLVRQLCQFCW